MRPGPAFALPDLQHLVAGWADRQHQPAAFDELLEQRSRLMTWWQATEADVRRAERIARQYRTAEDLETWDLAITNQEMVMQKLLRFRLRSRVAMRLLEGMGVQAGWGWGSSVRLRPPSSRKGWSACWAWVTSLPVTPDCDWNGAS